MRISLSPLPRQRRPLSRPSGISTPGKSRVMYMVKGLVKLGRWYVYTGLQVLCDRTLTGYIQLALTAASPWQWFCSTRTLSNCLETTITVVALDLWPWQWSLILDQKPGRKNGRNQDTDSLLARYALPYHMQFNVSNHMACRLRLCLCLAALACILRPTNILVWITLASVLLHRSTWDARKILIREGIICG